MTRQVNTGTRESFSHPRAPAYRGRGREEGARLRVNERSDTKIRSDRAGIRPPDGGAGPVSRWIARCSLGPLPLPQRNCSVLREASRPTDEETSDKRRGTWAIAKWDGPIRGMVAGRMFPIVDPRIGPTSCPIRLVLLLLKWNSKFRKVSSLRWIMDIRILEMEKF